MARLPTAIDVGEPRGARLSGAGVRPTDMGLSDLAQGLDQVGQAYFKHNDEEAQKKLQAAQAGYEGEFAQRAAGYDGQEPGFANAETARFDAYFKPVVNDPNLSDGLRFAMQKRLDDLKLRAGQRAIGIEAEKRGGVISEQRAALSAQNISVGLTKFQEVYGAAYKQLTDNYDGSTQDLAKQAGDQADIAMAAALDTVPEADRPAFQARMAALRPGLMAQAWTHEQTATQAYVVNKVKEAQGTTTNMVIGNPDAYSLASATSDELL
ncbi:MAG TPA: hypothetical protein VFH92_13135, partial [Phenylobacterium sp.]|nr:hypothetical protein [Phenylobacterium sp.]